MKIHSGVKCKKNLKYGNDHPLPYLKSCKRAMKSIISVKKNQILKSFKTLMIRNNFPIFFSLSRYLLCVYIFFNMARIHNKLNQQPTLHPQGPDKNWHLNEKKM